MLDDEVQRVARVRHQLLLDCAAEQRLESSADIALQLRRLSLGAGESVAAAGSEGRRERRLETALNVPELPLL